MTSTVDEVLSYTNVISDIVMVIVVLDIIALFIMLFLEKYDPRVFVTWLIVLILLPPVGFILYMYMGSTIYNRRKFIPKNISDTNLMLASQQGHVTEGMLMLLCYSLGLGIPFILSALLIDRLKSTFDLIKKYYSVINTVCGIFLIIMGILMMLGIMGRFLALLS